MAKVAQLKAGSWQGLELKPHRLIYETEMFGIVKPHHLKGPNPTTVYDI